MNKFSKLLVWAFACTAVWGIVGCADDVANSNQTQNGDIKVDFQVSSAQEEMLLNTQASVTRAAVQEKPYNSELELQDFAPRVHKADPHNGPDVYLIESTVEGIDPTMPEPSTRGNVVKALDQSFSTLGYRGDSPNTISKTPNYFYNEETLKTGALVKPIYWAWNQRYARFYGVYPQVKNGDQSLVLSPQNHEGTPYVDFTANTDIKQQVDLMTAYSGDVVYEAQGVAPNSSLKFYHALTAISFSVGNNLSYPDKIKKIEIKNAISKGRFIMQTAANGTGSKWDKLSDRKTFTLGDIDVQTKNVPGQRIVGDGTDNYTFLMIPQKLDNVEVVITLEQGKQITVKLSGEWKQGTSKVYRISNTDSGWGYTLLTDSPAAAEATDNASGNYGIISFRTDRAGKKQAVKWKVVGYSTDGGATFSATKPAWLTSLSKTEGDGGEFREVGNAHFDNTKTAFTLQQLILSMQEEPQRGTSTDPYDLSTHDVNGVSTSKNTANCYVISAQGYYKLPLVYGNGIKDGQANTQAYNPGVAGTKILSRFLDHRGEGITSPYITTSNGGKYTATGAKVVWADTDGLVVEPKISNGYLTFQVPNTFQNGNAVVAVLGDGGQILWSWHLWFAPAFVLDPITVKNKQGVSYTFPFESIGFKYTNYSGPAKQQRSVIVKVEQEVKNKGVKATATFTITQNGAGAERFGRSMLYQFGRKDPFPATDESMPVGSIKRAPQVKKTDISICNTILNPDLFYANNPITDWDNNFSYGNMWSATNTTYGINDAKVVKTVYDPSPVGFVVPASNAYSGFTTTGVMASDVNSFNLMDNNKTWKNGWHFKAEKGQSLFFPQTGWIGSNDSKLYLKDIGYYWVAVPTSSHQTAYSLRIASDQVDPAATVYQKGNGFAVRPMKEVN